MESCEGGADHMWRPPKDGSKCKVLQVRVMAVKQRTAFHAVDDGALLYD